MVRIFNVGSHMNSLVDVFSWLMTAIPGGMGFA